MHGGLDSDEDGELFWDLEILTWNWSEVSIDIMSPDTAMPDRRFACRHSRNIASRVCSWHFSLTGIRILDVAYANQ